MPALTAVRIDPLPAEAERPLWSVMIPTYNRTDYLGQALQSVLAQDPGPQQMQIEVVDNCSTRADPMAIVREVGGGRVLFHRNDENLGLFGNFNACIRRSRGQLVHILSDDDYVLPGFYHKVGEAFRASPQCAGVFARSLIVRGETAVEGATGFCASLAQGSDDPREFLMSNPVRTPAVAVRRSFYERQGGFDMQFTHIGDWEMWVRVIVRGGARMLDEPLACYREHHTSETSRVVRSAENLRDHLRLSASWRAEGVRGFDPGRFERETLRLAFLQALAALAGGDRQAFAANLAFWREHAAPSLYPLACVDAVRAVGRTAARKLRSSLARWSPSPPAA